MRVLVTGANGFIGHRITEALLDRKFEKVVMSGRKPPPQDDPLLARGASFMAADLTDKESVRELVGSVDTVVHCAGLAGTWGEYDDYYRANVLSTRHLLEAAVEKGVKRLVNISSPSIYFSFKDQFALKETDRPEKFADHYGRTKFEAEELVKAFHGHRLPDARQLQTVSLRPRSVIGAGDRNVLPRLMRLQKQGQLVQVGAGKNEVDITTIGNLVDAVLLCLAAPSEAMGETYNITNGQPIRFWDFVDQVMREVGLPTERRRLPLSLVMTLAKLNAHAARLLKRDAEPSLLPVPVGVLAYSMTLDISKAKSRLGYAPRYTTEDGIREFASWWKAKGET